MGGLFNIVVTVLSIILYYVITGVVFSLIARIQSLVQAEKVLITTVTTLSLFSVLFFALGYLFFYHFPDSYTGPCNPSSGNWQVDFREIGEKPDTWQKITISCGIVEDEFTNGVSFPSIIRDPSSEGSYIILFMMDGGAFGKSRLGSAEYKEGSVNYKGVVVKSPRNNLKNPSLFLGSKSEVYVLPEVSGKGYYPLYERSEVVSGQWRYVQNLLLPWKKPMLMSSVLFKDGRYYFFGHDEHKPHMIYVAYTSDLMDSWKIHPASPIESVKTSYPVSGVFEYGKKVLRIVREVANDGLYSYKTREVFELSKEKYEEKDVELKASINSLEDLRRTKASKVDVAEIPGEVEGGYLVSDFLIGSANYKFNGLLLSYILGITVIAGMCFVLLPTFSFLHTSLFRSEKLFNIHASPFCPARAPASSIMEELPFSVPKFLEILLRLPNDQS